MIGNPNGRTTMSLEIYWASGSCNSWRVMLALEIKKVPYQKRLLNISQRENRSPEFLILNPRGKVPVLRDGDFSLYESVAILLYLDRKYPEPPLFGRTPEEAGQILRQVLELINYVEPKVDRFALPIYQGKVGEQAAAIQTAARALHEELATLEASLTRRAYLAGDGPGATDCTAVAFVQHTLRAAGKEAAAPLELDFLPLARKYPALAAWVGRMEALPGYDRTYPPHWR
jgi:glutathione S-transferase